LLGVFDVCSDSESKMMGAMEVLTFCIDSGKL